VQIPLEAQPGSLDSSFNPGKGADSYVLAVVAQPNGKVVIAGGFTRIDDVEQNYISRLNPDGSIDPTFNPNAAPNDVVYAIALQGDGKLLLGGAFTNLGQIPRKSIARLNSDGTLDTSFDPGSGADGVVSSIGVQSDGKILVAGDFKKIARSELNAIARLNPDGQVDSSFNPGLGSNAFVSAFTLQSDGKILIGGAFSTVNGASRNRIARLNADGTLDNAFDPGLGANDEVFSIASQIDGKVVIAGAFTNFDGRERNYVARLNPDGSLDAEFNSGSGPNFRVASVVSQADGKVLLGGSFDEVNGIPRSYIARLKQDGNLDADFDPGSGANDFVTALALQPDGSVLVAGFFTRINGTPRSGVARLFGDPGIAAPTLVNPSYDGGSFAVGVMTVAGKIYTLEFKDSLLDVAWTALLPLTGDGTLKTVIDPGAKGIQRFYRMRVD